MRESKSFSTRSDSKSSKTVASAAPVSENVSSDKRQLWCASCNSPNHPNGSTWTGAKRSSRRQAVKDAAEHNRQYSHHATVQGPMD